MSSFSISSFSVSVMATGGVFRSLGLYIPASAMPLFMPEKLAEKGEALKKRGILKIKVDDRYVYMVSISLLIIIYP